jgi:hypothetical protein
MGICCGDPNRIGHLKNLPPISDGAGFHALQRRHSSRATEVEFGHRKLRYDFGFSEIRLRLKPKGQSRPRENRRSVLSEPMECCFNEISHLPAPLGLAARDRSARRALQGRDVMAVSANASCHVDQVGYVVRLTRTVISNGAHQEIE